MSQYNVNLILMHQMQDMKTHIKQMKEDIKRLNKMLDIKEKKDPPKPVYKNSESLNKYAKYYGFYVESYGKKYDYVEFGCVTCKSIYKYSIDDLRKGNVKRCSQHLTEK